MAKTQTSAWPRKRAIVQVLALAAVTRAAATAPVFGRALTSDPLSYFQQASEFAHGSAGKAFYWPPGTSMAFAPWVALLGDSHQTARIVACAYGILLVLAVMWLAAAIVRDRSITLMAGYLAAFYPPAVFMAGDPQSQIVAAIAVCCMLSSLVSAVEFRRWWWWMLCGLSSGFLAVTRPATLLLIPVPFVFIFFRARRHSTNPGAPEHIRRRERFAAITVLALGQLLFIVPVVAHNIDQGAGPTLATNDAVNLFLGNNRYTPLYWTSSLASGHRDEPFNSYYDNVRSQGDAGLRSAALDYVKAHPAESALRSANRARAFWGFDYYRAADLRSSDWPTAGVLLVLMLEAGGFLVAGFFVIGGTVGPFAIVRSWRVWLLYATVLLLWIPYLISFSVGIYHFPVMMLLLPVAAAAMHRVASFGVKTSLRAAFRSRALIIALLCFAAIQVEYAYWLVKFGGA